MYCNKGDGYICVEAKNYSISLGLTGDAYVIMVGICRIINRYLKITKMSEKEFFSAVTDMLHDMKNGEVTHKGKMVEMDDSEDIIRLTSENAKLNSENKNLKDEIRQKDYRIGFVEQSLTETRKYYEKLLSEKDKQIKALSKEVISKEHEMDELVKRIQEHR